MSQRALEAALGKLICDEAFRRAFFENAEAAAVRAGFHLTAIERQSLAEITTSAIETFVTHVNECVRWATEPGPQNGFGQTGLPASFAR